MTGEMMLIEVGIMGTNTMRKMKNIMLKMGLIIPRKENRHNHKNGTSAVLLTCV